MGGYCRRFRVSCVFIAVHGLVVFQLHLKWSSLVSAGIHRTQQYYHGRGVTSSAVGREQYRRLTLSPLT